MSSDPGLHGLLVLSDNISFYKKIRKCYFFRFKAIPLFKYVWIITSDSVREVIRKSSMLLFFSGLKQFHYQSICGLLLVVVGEVIHKSSMLLFFQV